MKIELTASDGHRFSAWRAGPAEATKALVVVQEIFGVNRHMRHVCEGFANQGFAVICPALFDRAERDAELGYEQADVQRGLALRKQVSDEQVMLDIEAAAAALPAGAARGIIGYCWGGSIAWWGATRSRSFKAAVGYYGGGIAASRDEKPNCPVQLHFGAEDKGIPLTDVEAIRAAQPGVEIHVYPGAGHGFSCEERSSYSPADAMLAEQRSLAFLAKHLG
ncbi:dienelactone hydrolase family protein [Pseudoroseomonas wenyumeiae]|uniref:Dienelactone hydrolase family protein n=1 Tax=Teichococcus wenyumeiae TaxID=2478470 RepID=A0A3A9JVM4_9PROT|nr:dienelactone hydrolase family protein [Pseudoroseomonas wenyumeiae]RKK03059.1 dienelactone hydrolase family protein [Pseudoroseomonas wenyumeiae]RMI24795.1 dienelactone hydrolase family protein [Pseudoroseomonas wenyumeiae]